MQIIHRFLQLLREWRTGISPPVFFSAAVFNLTLIAYAGLWTENAGRTFSALLHFITETFGWICVQTLIGKRTGHCFTGVGGFSGAHL